MKTKKQHGGVRKGAGRPPKPKVHTHQFDVEEHLFNDAKNKHGTKYINSKIRELFLQLTILEDNYIIIKK